MNLIEEMKKFFSIFFGVVFGPSQSERQAIAELMSYSDRELSDLGISRSSIIDAVLYGRPLDKQSKEADDDKKAVLSV